jgi:hypothetical protein
MLTNPQTSTIPLLKRLDAVFYQMRADRKPLTIEEVCQKADCFPTEVFRPASITHYRIAMQYVGGREIYRSEILDRVRQVLGRMAVKDITPSAIASQVGLKTRLLKEDVPEAIDLIEAAKKRFAQRIQTSGTAKCSQCGQHRPIHKTIPSQMWGKPVLLCVCKSCSP